MKPLIQKRLDWVQRYTTAAGRTVWVCRRCHSQVITDGAEPGPCVCGVTG
jgi:predicted metal-binding protein